MHIKLAISYKSAKDWNKSNVFSLIEKPLQKFPANEMGNVTHEKYQHNYKVRIFHDRGDESFGK